MPFYNQGLDLLRNVTTLDLRWLLLKGTGYTFNRDHDFVADLTPASNEVSVSGYARVALSTPGRTINDSTDRTIYTADSPDFGTLATGQDATALVLYVHVTNDSDSLLVVDLPFVAPIDTAALNPFVVPLTSGQIAYLDEA